MYRGMFFYELMQGSNFVLRLSESRIIIFLCVALKMPKLQKSLHQFHTIQKNKKKLKLLTEGLKIPFEK